MSSWHLQGDMKDGELVSSGGVCVGKCSLFFFFPCIQSQRKK